jgi:hypothetical protein
MSEPNNNGHLKLIREENNIIQKILELEDIESMSIFKKNDNLIMRIVFFIKGKTERAFLQFEFKSKPFFLPQSVNGIISLIEKNIKKIQDEKGKRIITR